MNNRKKLFMVLVGLFLYTGMYAQEVNDPNAQVREAKNYHGISVSSAFDVYLTQSNDEAVAISAATSKVRDMITVEVKEGILYIGQEKGLRLSNGNKKLKAYISFKQIDKLTASGACDVYISGTLKAADLDLHLSGASDLKGKLDIQKLTVDLSGASDMTVTGMAGQLDIEASGASNFKGYELVTKTCNASASGASDIKITVNKALSAHASGASDVKFKGNGSLKDVKSSGSSSVSRS